MWPPVIWVGKWILKELAFKAVFHYGSKFAKKKLKGKDNAERNTGGSEKETDE